MGAFSSVVTVTNGDEVELWWSEAPYDGNGKISRVLLDSAGAPANAITSFPDVGPNPIGLQVVRAGTHAALVWTEQQSLGGESSLQFARVEEDGESEPPRALVRGRGWLQAQSLDALADGYLLLYTHIYYADSLNETFALVLDADGSPSSPAVSLGKGAGAASVIQRGKRYLAAWTSEAGDGSFEAQELQRSLNIGWFDASGARTGELYQLKTPVTDEEHVDPVWVDMGEDVGLAWSEGSIIYICAGCYPDNELRFVVLDGDDLSPRSDVLELRSPTAFGLRYPRALRSGDDILITTDVTRHVDAEGASATLRCAR
jgi:hypothetical protein